MATKGVVGELFDSVFDAIADSAAEAANLKLRAALMGQLAAVIRRNGWTQAEAARQCGLTQPRINDLLRGRMSRFSLDALVNIAAALNLTVRVDIAES